MLTTLPAGTWTAQEVLALYRVRWHVEVVFKRIKQVLDLHREHCLNRQRAQASILAHLLAWILAGEEAMMAREHFAQALALLEDLSEDVPVPQPNLGQDGVVSEGMLASLRLDLLRSQVIGPLTAARFRACLPQLRRFVCGSLRQRTHWYTQTVGWLTDRPPIPDAGKGKSVPIRGLTFALIEPRSTRLVLGRVPLPCISLPLGGFDRYHNRFHPRTLSLFEKRQGFPYLSSRVGSLRS